MKKAYSNYNELLHTWMYSDSDFIGYTPGNRIFAEGDEIYSYGRHFMLAKKIGNETILVNTQTYSRTTSKHESLLRRAIPTNWNVIYVENPSSKPAALIQRSISKIKDYLSLIPKATSKKLIYLDRANGSRINILKLISLYPEQCTLADFRWLENPFEPKDYISEEWLTKETLRQEKETKLLAEIEKFRALKGEEQLVLWLNFEANSCYSYSGLTRLRYNEKTEEIQTTQGITIHKDKVKELYELLREGKDVIGLKIDNTYTVISLKDNILYIGCHKLDVIQLLDFGSRVFKNENIHRPVQSSIQS